MHTRIVYLKDQNVNECYDSDGNIVGTIRWRSWFLHPIFETSRSETFQFTESNAQGSTLSMRSNNEEVWSLHVPMVSTGFVEIKSARSGAVYTIKWQGLFHGEIQVFDSLQNIVVKCPVDCRISDFTLDVLDSNDEWNSASFLMLIAYCVINGFYGRVGLWR